MRPPPPCLCGCGDCVRPYRSSRRRPLYIFGHHLRSPGQRRIRGELAARNRAVHADVEAARAARARGERGEGLRAIGERYGISFERVRQIHARQAQRIREGWAMPGQAPCARKGLML
jgi:hypothetical protein